MRAAKWLVLLFTMLFFAYLYVTLVLGWWNYWKKKFSLMGDVENFVLLTVFSFLFVQIMKYVWKLEVRLLFR